jgi:hypothetical protein
MRLQNDNSIQTKNARLSGSESKNRKRKTIIQSKNKSLNDFILSIIRRYLRQISVEFSGLIIIILTANRNFEKIPSNIASNNGLSLNTQYSNSNNELSLRSFLSAVRLSKKRFWNFGISFLNIFIK